MDLSSSQKYEKDLLIILLNGVSDTDHDPVSIRSQELLEGYGTHL